MDVYEWGMRIAFDFLVLIIIVGIFSGGMKYQKERDERELRKLGLVEYCEQTGKLEKTDLWEQLEQRRK